ncbi:MAG: hypothetical protein C0473_00580 [Cyanobacteria bacterium DS3.002]|nr:hypothetical protein [Cyanobacteria bacterium DS3.002]MBA4049454.1 hypothetical protein [Cyanobacteria bacterium DS2.008]MBA4079050.1 hypothetical protein [Cyanobacteria bacterium PR.023]
MNFSALESFIDSGMSKTHIYQPAIILTLLEHGGSAAVEKIAAKCSSISTGSASEFQKKLQKYPKEALLKRGVITVEGSEFKLAIDFSALAENQKSHLIKLCGEKLEYALKAAK